MTDIESHDDVIDEIDVIDVIDEICKCAYLVACGDGELSEAEENALGEVRAHCRNFIDARKAMELLEETTDIKKARSMYNPDMPLLHNTASMFNTYLHEIHEALLDLKDRDDYLELVDSQASKITDKYIQLVTAFAAERVANADGDISFQQREVLNRLFTSWDITRQDYEFWFAKYAAPVMFGYDFDPYIKIEDFKATEEGDEVDVSAMLSEMFGGDSIEGLTESLEEIKQEQTNIENLPEIYQAIIAGDTKLLLEAIEAGADLNHKVEISGIKGLTPLMLAAEKTTLEMVKVLAEHGANLDDVTDERGYTPLLWAIRGKNNEIAKFLIDSGADIEPFADREADWSPLSMAALHHQVGIAKLLLSKGANPNWRDPNGNVPLKHAANQAETDKAAKLVKLLLKNKADPNLHDDEGFYPIHSAIDHNNVKVTEILLSGGVPADLCFPDDSQEVGSLLKHACKRGCGASAVKSMQVCGIDVPEELKLNVEDTA